MSYGAPPPFDPNRRVVLNRDLTWSFMDPPPAPPAPPREEEPPPFSPYRRAYLTRDGRWTYNAAREHRGETGRGNAGVDCGCGRRY